MPGGDGTGPWGTWVNCTPVDEYGNPLPRPFGRRRFWRRGRGWGRGFGRGWRWRAMPVYAEPVPAQPVAPVQPQMTQEQEITALENEAKMIEQEQKELKTELDDIKKRIEELKKKE